MSLDRRDFLRSAAFASGTWVLGSWPEGAEALGLDQPQWPKNTFLEGNFAPVHEEVTADDLRVIGKLPKELDGMFVRNGPNPMFPPRGNYHWFDGDGMLHGVRLRDGKASYRNRYVQTASWQAEKQAGKAIYTGMMDPPAAPLVKNAPRHNKANTALVWHNRKLLALWEGGPPWEVKLPGLETVAECRFGGKLRHSFTAHPKVDPATGEMLCFGYNLVSKPHLFYSVINPQGEITHATPIDLPRGVMMHDFAITAQHSIFMDLPETFDMKRAMSGKHPLVFRADLPSRFGILPRHGAAKEIKWFESPSCFVFHVLNAYDEGDDVVLQACRYNRFPDLVDFEKLTQGTGSKKAEPLTSKLYQWRFNLKTGAVKEGPLDDRDAEFPRINEALTGRKTRYGYAGGGGDFFGQFHKHDFVKGTTEVHAFGKGRNGGEGVFVPAPDARAEDDGWLMTYVHDTATDKSELILVDCRDFQKSPIARILLPQRVPYGFHGLWVDGKQLA